MTKCTKKCDECAELIFCLVNRLLGRSRCSHRHASLNSLVSILSGKGAGKKSGEGAEGYLRLANLFAPPSYFSLAMGLNNFHY